MAQRQAAAEAGAQNMQGMMEMAQKIMEKCGEDEACIQQETMKMSQQIDPNDPKLKAAKQNIETASAVPGARRNLTGETSSFSIGSVSSIKSRRTMRPSGPVWCVTSFMPRILFASSRASSTDFAILTPPPLPRPPA